jgi:hypothetical protein
VFDINSSVCETPSFVQISFSSTDFAPQARDADKVKWELNCGLNQTFDGFSQFPPLRLLRQISLSHRAFVEGGIEKVLILRLHALISKWNFRMDYDYAVFE